MSQPSSSAAPYSRVQLLVILLTPIIVVVSSTLLYFSGILMPDERSNNGILLTPVLSVTDFGLPEVEITQDRQWQVIQFSPNCSEACLEKAIEQRQIHISLGKRQPRLQRVLLTETDVTAALGEEFPLLKVDQLNTGALSSALLSRIPADVLADNPIFIADPFGNVMLYFTREHDYRAQISDIKKLLNLSTIG